MTMVRAGIVGGSGYGGIELLRLLLGHPRVRVAWVTSRAHAGRPVGEVYPSLSGRVAGGLVFDGEMPDAGRLAEVDVVFSATPAYVAAELAPAVLAAGARLIDLSADFRFKDPERFAGVYGRPHPHPELLAEAVYGLPEWYGDALRGARIVANPGCYPTAALLAVVPLLRGALAATDRPWVVSATSGISGAGSQPGPMYHFPAATENVQPYGVPHHRHGPEMEQELAVLGGGAAGPVVFIPHLVPASRGILATCVVPLARAVSEETLLEHYRRAYADAPFVRVLAPPALPQTKAVYGSNFCDVAVRLDRHAGMAVVMTAIDNLVKGASGQAVQNLNRMKGWNETSGLEVLPVYP